MSLNGCLLLLAVLACAEAHDYEKKETAVEARGKAKFALWIHFLYVVATKLFVLKIVYGGIFYALVVKGWQFVTWFIHYLKEKKSHDYVEYHEPYHHDHHHGHDHYDHDHYGHYGHDSYGPYAYDKHGYGTDNNYKHSGYKSGMNDADGSYSVKS